MRVAIMLDSWGWNPWMTALTALLYGITSGAIFLWQRQCTTCSDNAID